MLDILSITGPIYLAIAAGFLATRFGLFAKADMRVFGKFVVQIALPALLFNALSQKPLREVLNAEYLAVYALGSLGMLGAGLFYARVLAGKSLSYSSYFAMGVSCPNSGFVGYPIVLLTMGPIAGVVLALNMIVENLLLIPLLLALADAQPDARGQWLRSLRQTLQRLLSNPMILAIIAGVALSLAGWQLPGAVARTVNIFAQASGALALFAIGGTLVGLPVKGLRAEVAQIAFGKLILHPLLTLAVLLWVVPIQDMQLREAVLITAALPMLSIYPVLAQKHGHEGVSAAALVVTTALAFFTLSVLLWALRGGLIWSA